jgi:WD40 repeat protein
MSEVPVNHPDQPGPEPFPTAPAAPLSGNVGATDEAPSWDFLAPPQAPDELGRLGSFRVLGVLGAGGMGIVFRAEDTLLLRRVALKVLRPQVAGSPGARERFLGEARALAALRHEHIAEVYMVGEEGGVPFLAMHLFEGEPLADRLRRHGPLPIAEVLRIGREVAEGLQAAHDKGIVHRDVKPSNIWLEGEPGALATGGRVKLLDFGLAWRIGTAHLTQTGMVLGTPAYMAPEQARGETASPRSDLFGLGVVLYQMCTSRLPFSGPDVLAVLHALAVTDPVPPGRLRPDAPATLAELIQRLLAKRPEQRPASAAEVARALAAIIPAPVPGVVAEEPTRPLPVQPAQNQPTPPRPARRRKALWALLGLPVLALAGLWLLWPGCSTPRVVRLELGDRPTDKQPPRQPGLAPVAGLPPWAVWAPGPTEGVPDGLVPRPARLPGVPRWQIVPRAPIGAVRAMAWKPDGQMWTVKGSLLACGGDDPYVRIYDGRTGKLVRCIAEPGRVTALAWSRDGKRLAWGSGRPVRRLRIWEAGTGRLGPEWPIRASWSDLKLVWAPDSQRLLTAGNKGNDSFYEVWKVGADKAESLTQEKRGRDEHVISVAWSPNGRRYAAGLLDGTARVFDAASGNQLAALRVAKDKRQVFLTWNKFGEVQAWAQGSGELHRWDGKEGGRDEVQPCTRAAVGASWGAGGGWLATWDPLKVHVQQVWKKEFMGTLPGPGLIVDVAWSPGGEVAVSGDRGGLVVHISPGLLPPPDHRPGERLWKLPGEAGTTTLATLDPQGRRLATAIAREKVVRLWDVAKAAPGPVLQAGQTSGCLAWSPDGKRLVAGGTHLVLLDPDGRDKTIPLNSPAPGLGLAWSPDSKRLAVNTGQHVQLYEPGGAADGQPLLPALDDGNRPAQWVSWGGHYLAAVAFSKVYTWDMRNPQGFLVLDPAPVVPRTIAVSPDGKLLAIGDRGGVLLCAPGDGQRRKAFRTDDFGLELFPPLAVKNLAWSSDSRRLAWPRRAQVTVLDIDSGKARGLRGNGLGIEQVAWAGNTLATVDGSRTVLVWDAERGEPLWGVAHLPGDRVTVFSAAGELRPEDREAEAELAYLVERSPGVFDALSAHEFRRLARAGK